jgi:hypothetical protein
MLPPYGAHEGPNAAPPYADPDKPTPYLGIKSRLSQVWINRWTILILLVLVRVLMAITSLNGDMDNAQSQALSACNSVQSMGSAMASLPHYMSQGVNELTAQGITKTVHGLVDVLELMITGVEGLVLFYIDFLVQTYLCLFTLVARGAAEMALSIASDVTNWLNKELPSIENGISDVVSGVESGLSKLNDSINDIKKDCDNFITKGLCDDLPTVPTIDLTSQMDNLKNLKIPSSVNDDISKANSTIPTFDQVKNATSTAIKFPFEMLKDEVKKHLGNYSFDSSTFPVPDKQALSFCGKDDGIDKFFDGLADTLVEARKIFIAVLIIIAVLACVPMAFVEIYRWRTTKKRAEMVGTAHDSLDVVYLVSRPHTSSLGMKAATFFNNSRHQVLVRWIFAYAFSVPALVLLSLGLAGLLSCLCQYILLKSVEKEVPELTAQVSQFADKVVGSLENSSVHWAQEANSVLNSTQSDINHNVFGWVNVSTSALNNTLNVFLNDSNEVINKTFGNTVLYDAVKGIFDCVVELKVESVEKALTWASDNAYITIPTLPNNTFSVGASASINSGDSFLSDPGSTTSNQITEVVTKVTNKLQKSIETEAKISSALVLLWVLIVLMGVMRALFLCCTRQRVRGDGGGQRPVGQGGFEPVEPPMVMIGGGVVDSRGTTAAATIPASYEVEHNSASSRAVPTERQRNDPFQQAEYEYQDQKMGFAGERDYSAAVHPTHSSNMNTRQSSYVEYGGDEKRR